MTNIDSDQDINAPKFIDCLGTCRTPMGCTCGKMKNQSEVDAEEENSASLPGASPKESAIIEEAKAELKAERLILALTPKNKPAKEPCCKRNNYCCAGSHKLEVYNWLEGMPPMIEGTQMVEVQFKNTRKGYYLNSNNIELCKGDIVAVEALPGHDIGEVTMIGKLVELQMKKCNFKGEVKRVYRHPKPGDLERYEEAKKKEHKTMLRSREIAEELGLAMKISDVEYQGDGNKAIFYYIADERVDFRQLIKVYASEFRVKIEMKQIGARQEAGRVGGIGPCGRELCCSSSMSNFISVSTSAARLQEIPLNPQKLAGQCGKLKCCLNFEVDTYVEAQRKLPSRDVPLETRDSTYYNFKTDVLSGTMIYSTDKHFAANLVTLDKERVFEVMRLNKKGEKPPHLQSEEQEQAEKPVSHDLLDQASITRFDNTKGGRNNKKRRQGRGDGQNEQNGGDRNQPRSERERPKLNKIDGSKDAVPQARPPKEGQEKKIQRSATNSEKPQAEGNNNPNNKSRNNRNRNNRNNNRNRPPREGNQNTPKTDA